MKSVVTLNRNLAIAFVALVLLSAASYHNSVQRAERFERGQKFLPNLNPDEIVRIEIAKGAEETVLRRTADGDRFVLPSEDGYRADNASVNRFVKDVLGLALEKEVGEDPDLFAELGLAPVKGEEGESASEETIDVTFLGASDKEMVRFLVGSSPEDASGNYVRRVGDDQTIYLTDRQVYLGTDGDSFLEKEIVDVPRDSIRAIRGSGFQFVKEEGGELELQEIPEGKKASSEASQMKSALSGLRFTEHHLADASEVRGLAFDARLEVELDDGSGYVVDVAERDSKHYLRIEGFHTAGRITIARDASEEEVKATSEVLERAQELEEFNAFHGTWVYEVSEFTADRVRTAASELFEDA
ncbi:MAG: DUF4340 domain-containing protein [Holophagales bacterium]|nr:DUF4340 domain-containing protein [Holophagales bacterium]